MPNEQVAVRSASSPSQVRKAAQHDRNARQQELLDLEDVLKLPHGRRVLWRLIGECNPLRSIMDTNGSRMFYNAGQQDIGHWLIGEIAQADPEAWLLMQREAGKLAATLPSAPPTSEDDE